MVKQAFTSIALMIALLLVLAGCGEEGRIESQSNDMDNAAEAPALSTTQEEEKEESTEPTYMLRTKTMIQYPTSSEESPFVATTTYSYDAQGNLLEEQYESHGNERDRVYSTTYSYDESGNLISMECPAWDDLTLYTYDLAGNVLTDTRTSVGGALYSFGTNGEVTNYQYYSNANDTPTVTSYSYDASGNCIATLNFSFIGITQNTYLYDSHGNLIQEENDYYASDGSTRQSRVVTSYEYIAVP